jgi:hypothetical protein
MLEGVEHKLREKCSAGCKREGNVFPEVPTCAMIAKDKLSNLNCDSKWFSL